MNEARTIKLVAIDLDGTLLNSKRVVSPLTARTVSTVARQGIHIVLVSARMLPSVLNYKEQLNLHDPVIAYGGAAIKPHDSRPIWLGIIDPKVASKTIHLSKSYDVRLFTYVGDKWYVDNLSSEAMEEGRAIGIAPIVVDNMQAIVDQGVAKFTIIGESNMLTEIADKLSRQFASHVCCVFSRPTDLEVSKKGISKSKALGAIGKLLHIRPGQMMAIGDERNDMDMLQFAGTAVAMGNAPDEVKRIADIIAPSNDNEGVASVLKYFFVDTLGSNKPDDGMPIKHVRNKMLLRFTH